MYVHVIDMTRHICDYLFMNMYLQCPNTYKTLNTINKKEEYYPDPLLRILWLVYFFFCAFVDQKKTLTTKKSLDTIYKKEEYCLDPHLVFSGFIFFSTNIFSYVNL